MANLRILNSVLGYSKIVQMLLSMICLMCLIFATCQDEGKVIDLPMHWRIEFFIVVMSASIAYCLCLLCIYVSALHSCFPCEVYKIDIVFQVLFTTVIGGWSFFVLETAFYYRKNYPTWDSIQVFDSCFAGFVTSATYFVGFLALARRLRGSGQFRRRILQEENVDDVKTIEEQVDAAEVPEISGDSQDQNQSISAL